MNNNPNDQFNPTPMDNGFGQPQPVVPPVQPVVTPEPVPAPQPVQPEPVVAPQPVVTPEPTPMAQPQPNMYQQPAQPAPMGPQPAPVYQQPVYQQPVQQEPPKKNKSFLIIVIILVLVIVGLVVFFVLKKTGNNDNGTPQNNNTAPTVETNTNTNVNTTPVSSGNKGVYESFEFELPSGYEEVEDPDSLHIVNMTKKVEAMVFVDRGYTVEDAIASLDDIKAEFQEAGITFQETKEITINNHKFLVLIGVAENIPIIFTYNTVGNYSVASSLIYNVGSESNDSVINELGTMLSNGQDKGTSSFTPGENKKYEVRDFKLGLNDLRVNK